MQELREALMNQCLPLVLVVPVAGPTDRHRAAGPAQEPRDLELHQPGQPGETGTKMDTTETGQGPGSEFVVNAKWPIALYPLAW